MLTVQNIRKTYKGGIKAVDDVSFTIEPGKVLGILGPNGAGKTTTIRMILNIIKPDAGSITFRGRTVDEFTKNSIGYLPEERGLYRKSTIADTLYYFASIKSAVNSNTKREISSWLERFELNGMEKRKVEELSKGNQQKVQFIAAALHNPDLLILDEPFSGLDPLNQLKFKDVVLSLREQGKAIIFCTHQLESAEKICDDIVLYNQGKSVVSGTVEEVKKRFGSNVIRLEFEGDATFLSALPIVKKSEIFPNYAEVELTDGSGLNDLVPHVVSRLQLSKIERMQPSLLSIFIDIVGKGNLPEDFVQPISV